MSVIRVGLVRARTKTARLRGNSMPQVGPLSPKLGPEAVNTDECVPGIGKFEPESTKMDRIRPRLAKCRLSSTEFGRASAKLIIVGSDGAADTRVATSAATHSSQTRRRGSWRAPPAPGHHPPETCPRSSACARHACALLAARAKDLSSLPSSATNDFTFHSHPEG